MVLEDDLRELKKRATPKTCFEDPVLTSCKEGGYRHIPKSLTPDKGGYYTCKDCKVQYRDAC
ncbi:MAG: hypothetical protein ABIH37_04420 [archaeon]